MKTVKVNTLKQGDYFILPSKGYTYVATEDYDDGAIECVCLQSGKVFTCERDVEVVPVEVTIKTKIPVEHRPPVDLTNKCGSCIHASYSPKEFFNNQESIVMCKCPNRVFKNTYSAYRARTTKCCREYVSVTKTEI